MATLEQTQSGTQDLPRVIDVPRRRDGRTAGEVVLRVAIYAVIVLGALIVLVPFGWMISTSLKSQDRLFVYPPEWIPAPPQWACLLYTSPSPRDS